MVKWISDQKTLILQYSISYTPLPIHKWGILKEIALFLSCLTWRTVIECGEIFNAGETKKNWEQPPEAKTCLLYVKNVEWFQNQSSSYLFASGDHILLSG